MPARRAGDARTGGHRLKPKALRVLAKEVLGETIQEGEHSPAVDARVALHIYRVHAAAWFEHPHMRTTPGRGLAAMQP